MKYSFGMLALILLLLPAGLAAQQDAPENRRAGLQDQVFERFFDQAVGRLGLAEPARSRLEQVLKRTGERRRALAREGMDLRRDFERALGDANTPEAEFRTLLERFSALRAQEYELSREEHQALGDVLTPRQQAELMGMRARFTERVQELRRRRNFTQDAAPRPNVKPRAKPPRP